LYNWKVDEALRKTLPTAAGGHAPNKDVGERGRKDVKRWCNAVGRYLEKLELKKKSSRKRKTLTPTQRINNHRGRQNSEAKSVCEGGRITLRSKGRGTAREKESLARKKKKKPSIGSLPKKTENSITK